MFKSKLETTDLGFYDLFYRQASLVRDGATAFVQVLEDWPAGQAHVDRLNEIERNADDVGHAAIDLLNRTVVTPLGRDDILNLVSGIDDVLDTMDAAAQRMVLFEVDIVPPQLLALGQCLAESAARVVDLMAEFKGNRDPTRLRALYDDIRRLENDGDRILRSGLGGLFREHASNPLRILKLKDIFEMVEVAVDQCKAVSNTVAGLLLTRA